MNKLVEEIIKPILEANSDIKKVVGIFGGRFQPFGPHHKKVYEWLAKQFDDAYITTSNIKSEVKKWFTDKINIFGLYKHEYYNEKQDFQFKVGVGVRL